MPLEKRPSYFADLVHADHPHKPPPGQKRPKEGDTDETSEGSRLDAKTAPQGVIIASEFTSLALHRFAKKRFSGCYLASGAQPEVDGPTRPINSTIEVAPLAPDLDVCLVNTPRQTNCKGISAPALLELRRVALNPSHDGRVCQRQAALRHHLYHVAQAQFEPEAPAHAKNDDLAA